LRSLITERGRSKIVEASVKPPAAGKGRPKGALNKTTVAMKEAVLGVYADLQESAGGGRAHFKAWAEANPTDFYKGIASKLLPMDVRGSHDINVGGSVLDHREAAQAEIDDIFGDGAMGPLIERK
jgi:hypothetical protein